MMHDGSIVKQAPAIWESKAYLKAWICEGQAFPKWFCIGLWCSLISGAACRLEMLCYM